MRTNYLGNNLTGVIFEDVEELGETLDELDFAVEHVNHSPVLTELRDKLRTIHDRVKFNT